MKFGEKVVRNTFFALVDLFLTKIGSTVAFILLVRFLPGRDIATIGIGMGYLVLVFYLDVGPIRVLLRDYPKITKNRNERDELLTALFFFWGMQAIAMLLLYFGLRFFLFSKLDLPDLSFLFFGMVVDTMALSFQDWIKIVFYTDLRQSFATKIGFYLNLIRLACYGLLFLWPSLVNYAWILIITSCGNCIIWGFIFQRSFFFRPILSRRSLALLKQSLGSYGFWDHLNRMSIDTLFTIDTVVLSWVAFIDIQDIGNYTIALKFTSLFFLIPMQLGRGLQVVLSNYQEERKRFDSINTFFKVNFIFSFMQLLFVFVGGNWLIHLLFGANTHPDVIRFVLIIAVGVTIMNLSIPLISIINTFCSLRQAFIYVFLPALGVGCSIYVWTAIQWGAIGIAYANIFNYTILAISLAAFTFKKYRFPFIIQIITQEERRLLREFVRGIF